jgi:hypothetical protein
MKANKATVFGRALTLLGFQHAMFVKLGDMREPGGSTAARALCVALGGSAVADALAVKYGVSSTFDDVPDDEPWLADDTDYYACSDDGDCDECV